MLKLIGFIALSVQTRSVSLTHPTSSRKHGCPSGRFKSSTALSDIWVWISIIRELQGKKYWKIFKKQKHSHINVILYTWQTAVIFELCNLSLTFIQQSKIFKLHHTVQRGSFTVNLQLIVDFIVIVVHSFYVFLNKAMPPKKDLVAWLQIFKCISLSNHVIKTREVDKTSDIKSQKAANRVLLKKKNTLSSKITQISTYQNKQKYE